MNNKKSSLRPLAATAILTFAAVAAYLVPANHAEAQQGDTRSKIKLMASALRARNEGDLLSAKKDLEELVRMVPNDTSVQRLLASVNDALDRQYNGNVPQWAATTPAVSAQPVSDSISTSSSDWDFGGAATDTVVVAQNDSGDDMDWDFSSAEPAATATSEELPVAETYPVGGASSDSEYVDVNAIPDSGTGAVYNYDEPAAVSGRSVSLLKQAREAIANGNPDLAYALLDNYEAQNGYDSKSRKTEYDIRKEAADPRNVDIREASPGLIESQREITKKIASARAQYIAGDLQGAVQNFNEVEALDPDNSTAKYFLSMIATERADRSQLDLIKTRNEMIGEVAQNWQRPRVFNKEVEGKVDEGDKPLLTQMKGLVIPEVNFSGTPINQVAATLSVLSEEFDASGKGINFIVLAPNGENPAVTVTLKKLTLNRVLDFITQSVNFGYTVEDDAVILRPGISDGGDGRLVTEFFPVTRPMIIRMIGVTSSSIGGGNNSDPFATGGGGGFGGGNDSDEEEEGIKNFLQKAGVPFDSVPSASLAMGDGELIVTNLPPNMEKIEKILRRFSEVKQVEIEAKFLEVQQGDLDELGISWSAGDSGQGVFEVGALGNQRVFEPGTSNDNFINRQLTVYDNQISSQNRTLAQTFSSSTANSFVGINGEAIASNAPPVLPNILDTAADAGNLLGLRGIVGSFTVDAVLRALSRKQGTDLMSAPKVTVLSGKTAEIVVAQELRYPESYGDLESEVSQSGSSFSSFGGLGGSASASVAVAITAGTPQDFVTRNVGVEMEVVPTVEKDNRISLQLEPTVTEFEGFVEYGGPSVAVTGGITVTVPAGFYQPIFSVRKVRTEVTVWDGATVVLGGLTRDEVKYVNDKVPVLGDIPLVGKLFRSEGESSQKRNLLIFVTANLVSPGGSPARQDFSVVQQNNLFSNPTIITPGGAVHRKVSEGGAK